MKKYEDKLCEIRAVKVGLDDSKKQMIYYKGERVPGVVWTRVYDGSGSDVSYVIAKIFIKIK